MNESDQSEKPVVLSTRGLAKNFGAVSVLRDIDFDLRAGEIRAILGENGAGKSTLMKLLAGFETVSAGELTVFSEAGSGVDTSDWNPRLAEHHGVVMIHQELNLTDQLTVAENIFLGQELRKGLFLDKRAMQEKSLEYLRSLHCEVSPNARVGDLAVSAKQMIEIARTRAKQCRVLIFDEPTAVLTSKESEVLYQLIHRLSEEGVAIVFISHKLEEIKLLAHSVTILRDGEIVGNYAAAELEKEDMVRLMVGRELSSLFPDVPAARNEVALAVKDLLVAGTNSPCSFDLRQGEILGFSGLVGSGRTALLETVVGLRKPSRNSSGLIEIEGKAVTIKQFSEARKHGVAYLTKDRKGSGLLLDKGLSLNFSLFALEKFSKLLIDTRAEQQAFESASKTFDIRSKDKSIVAGNLSGGNQQKLLLAKIMEAEPGIVIIDEPTRGIDIGTKSQIYHFISELVASGHAVVLISSDITEIIGLCHRVAVMYHGELTGILEGEQIDEQEIMRYATGLKGRDQSELKHGDLKQTEMEQEARG